MRRIVVCLGIFGLILLQAVALTAQKKQKLKLPDVLAGHLASLGKADQLAAVKGMRATGKGRLRVLVGAGRILEGDSMLTSEGLDSRSQIVFSVSDYPGEDVSFDGKSTYVAQLQAGQRSEIGDFLYQYESILKEGILGGVATTAWPLRDLEGRKARLRYKGLKKIYDGQLHELEYRPRRGDSSVEITIYLEQETFRHAATLIRVEVPEGGPSISQLDSSPGERAEASARQVSTIYLLEERFGNYQDVNGLMLPSVRRVRLTRQGQAPNVGLFTANSRDRSMLEWQMEFEKWEMNPVLEDNYFKIY